MLHALCLHHGGVPLSRRRRTHPLSSANGVPQDVDEPAQLVLAAQRRARTAQSQSDRRYVATFGGDSARRRHPGADQVAAGLAAALPLPFADLSLPFTDLSLPFADLSLPFTDLSTAFRWPFINLSLSFIAFTAFTALSLAFHCLCLSSGPSVTSELLGRRRAMTRRASDCPSRRCV